MKTILIALALVSLAGCASLRSPQATQIERATSRNVALDPGNHERSLTLDGRERTYVVHLPPAIASRAKLPLVLVFHGGAGGARFVEQTTGMSALADKESFIVVYPNGSGRFTDRMLTWNAGNCCGYALANKVDDVGFVRALNESLLSDYPIDPKRVYATGISNGGMMSYRLACELSEQIAAIAPVAGALNVDCQPAQPVSVIAFHGTEDQSVLYEGGKPRRQADPNMREDPSVAYAMNFWSSHNGCGPTPRRTERGKVLHDQYSGCIDRTGVVLYTIVGGRHAWPSAGGRSVLPESPSKEISATSLMWEFFARHPKR